VADCKASSFICQSRKIRFSIYLSRSY